MKKVFLAIAVMAMIGFASCSKEKTCKCTYETSIGGIVSEFPLGEQTITEGSCSDLENNGAWDAQLGNFASVTIHCEKVK